MWALKIYRVYSKTNMASFKITKETTDWSFLSGRLRYVHIVLKVLCTFCRLIRNVVNWRSLAAYKLTMKCLFIGVVWLVLPVHFVVLWLIRILAWTFLGPWMKLVDIIWLHKYYKTRQELLEEIRARKNEPPKEPEPFIFDSFLESDHFHKLHTTGRIAAEDSLKLKDMRERVFGEYSEQVPAFDTSRFPSLPLPDSTAYPSNAETAHAVEVAIKKQKVSGRGVPGQRLQGHMIHTAVKPQ